MTIYDINSYKKEYEKLSNFKSKHVANKTDEVIKIQLASSYFNLKEYKKSLSTINDIKNHTLFSFTLFLELLYKSHRFYDIIDLYNTSYNSNNTYKSYFSNKKPFDLYIKAYFKCYGSNFNSNLSNIMKSIKFCNFMQVKQVFENIAYEFNYIPTDENLFGCQQFLSMNLDKKNDLYSVNNIDNIVTSIKNNMVDYNVAMIQYGYPNEQIISNKYFDYRKYFIKKLNEIPKNDNKIINFAENVTHSLLYKFDEHNNDNNHVENIKNLYRLSKKFQFPQPENNNLAIITKTSSLTKYDYWKFSTIKYLFKIENEFDTYLFTQSHFNIMDKQTYIDYSGIPFKYIIPINSSHSEINILFQKHNIGKILLFDPIEDNFQYYIGSNFNNSFCFKELDNDIYPCPTIDIFNEDNSNVILANRYNFDEKTSIELDINPSSNYVLVLDEIQFIDTITLYKIKDILARDSSFILILLTSTKTNLIINRIKDIFSVYYHRVKILANDNFIVSKYFYFCSTAIAVNNNNIKPQTYLESIYSNKIILTIGDITNKFYSYLLNLKYNEEFFKCNNIDELINKTISFSLIDNKLHNFDSETLTKVLCNPGSIITIYNKIGIETPENNDDETVVNNA